MKQELGHSTWQMPKIKVQFKWYTFTNKKIPNELTNGQTDKRTKERTVRYYYASNFIWGHKNWHFAKKKNWVTVHDKCPKINVMFKWHTFLKIIMLERTYKGTNRQTIERTDWQSDFIMPQILFGGIKTPSVYDLAKRKGGGIFFIWRGILIRWNPSYVISMDLSLYTGLRIRCEFLFL